jgi:hypothetical protein
MNAANRLLWTVIGLVLLAAGVIATLIHFGKFPWVTKQTAVLPSGFLATWHRFGAWSPVVAIAAGVLLVVLGLLLLRAELRWRGAPAMDGMRLTTTARADVPAIAPGTTRIGTAALERALARDLGRAHPVREATAHLTGKPDQPTLRLRLDVAPGADLHQVKSDVDSALARFTTTSGLTPRLADVDIRLINQAPTDQSRVR